MVGSGSSPLHFRAELGQTENVPQPLYEGPSPHSRLQLPSWAPRMTRPGWLGWQVHICRKGGGRMLDPSHRGPAPCEAAFCPSSSTVAGAALSCLRPPSSSSWGPQGRPRVRAGIRRISQSSSFKTYLPGPLPPHLCPPLPRHPGLQSSVSCPGTQGLVPDLPRDWVDISFLNLLSHLQNRSLVPAGGVGL